MNRPTKTEAWRTIVLEQAERLREAVGAENFKRRIVIWRKIELKHIRKEEMPQLLGTAETPGLEVLTIGGGVTTRMVRKIIIAARGRERRMTKC